MAYFSNGAEGEMYEERYCNRCIHGPEYDSVPPVDCPILTLHSVWNYDAIDKNRNGRDKKYALEMFIPTGKNGFAERCKMFVERKA